MTNDLPPIIDIRDALRDIESQSDTDVSDDTAAIRESLDELAGRDRAGEQSVLDDIDDRVLGLRESLDGKADRRAEGIQNRIRTYRNTRRESSATLSLSGAELTADSGTRIDAANHNGETVTLSGTLVNGGSARAAVVALDFHDREGTPIRKVESREVGLAPDEHRDVNWTVYVPHGTTYYATTALDADDPRSVSDEEALDTG